MRLGAKIKSGFSTILLITVLLSGFSLLVMTSLTRESRVLSEEYMPQTRIANGLERHVQNLVSEMQGYDLSYEASFLAKARLELAQVKNVLQEAGALAAKSEDLGILKEMAAAAEARIGEYEKLVGETEKAGKEIQAVRKKLEVATSDFVTPCNEFLDEQTGGDEERNCGRG